MENPYILMRILTHLEKIKTDVYQFALINKTASTAVQNNERFHMDHVISEISPYVLRTILRGRNVSRFTILDHGGIDEKQKANVPFTGFDPDFYLGVRSVFTENGIARSWMERREYVRNNFMRADHLDVASLQSIVAELEEIIEKPPTRNEFPGVCRHTIRCAIAVKRAFQVVLHVKINSKKLNPEHDRSKTVTSDLVRNLRTIRMCNV